MQNLYSWLEKREKHILFSDLLQEESVSRLKPKLIINYNYNHIIKKDVIALSKQRNYATFYRKLGKYKRT